MFTLLTLMAGLLAADATLSDAPVTKARSPYVEWPEQGMRPVRDKQADMEELTALQAAMISTAYGQQPWREQEHVCAGNPTHVRPRAAPSNSCRYIGYAVGGGAVGRGDVWHDEDPSSQQRRLDDGTFGWDYLGYLGRKRIALSWSHRRLQSGVGAYATDGPKLFHHE